MLLRMKQNRCCLEWIKIDVAWNKTKSMLLGMIQNWCWMNQNRCCLEWNKTNDAWNETKSMLLRMKQNRCYLEENKIDVAYNGSLIDDCGWWLFNIVSVDVEMNLYKKQKFSSNVVIDNVMHWRSKQIVIICC